MTAIEQERMTVKQADRRRRQAEAQYRRAVARIRVLETYARLAETDDEIDAWIQADSAETGLRRNAALSTMRERSEKLDGSARILAGRRLHAALEEAAEELELAKAQHTALDLRERRQHLEPLVALHDDAVRDVEVALELVEDAWAAMLSATLDARVALRARWALAQKMRAVVPREHLEHLDAAEAPTVIGEDGAPAELADSPMVSHWLDPRRPEFWQTIAAQGLAVGGRGETGINGLPSRLKKRLLAKPTIE